VTFSQTLEAALAGTLRQDPPATSAALSPADAEHRLLQAASYAGLRHLAGRPFDQGPAETGAEPAPPETRQVVPPTAALRLGDLLDEWPELLHEWLSLAAERNLRVPHVLLPDLLDVAARAPDSALAALIGRVGGERAAWLASLNPAWSFDTAPAERNEAQLESALRQPRKEARTAALRQIRRIPGSRFGQRWAERARSLISIADGRLVISEPAEADPAWLSDGLEPGPPKGVGQTAWLVRQVVSLTPPSVWPLDVLPAFEASEWAEPLLSGLGEAAAAYADATWIAELLVVWARAGERKERVPLHGPSLFAALDAGQAEEILTDLLDQVPQAVLALVGVREDRWSAALSATAVRRLPTLLHRWSYSATTFLREAAPRLDPDTAPDIARLLDNDRTADWLRPRLEALLQTLAYRQHMRREFSNACYPCHPC
jgi:hypothetical protein